MTAEDFIGQLCRSRVDWQVTTECKYIFQAVFQGELVKLRLNDFPEEPFCTVMHDGQEINIEPFPEIWTLPKHREKQDDQS